MSAGVLLRAARLSGAVADLLVADGRVSAIGPELAAPAGSETVDLEGRTVLPGLWDNHVHFDQWALSPAAAGPVAATGSAADAVELVAQRLRSDPPAAGAPLVGAGFRDALWPDAPAPRRCWTG